MSHRRSARSRRGPRILVAGLLAVIAAALGPQLLASSTAASPIDVPRSEHSLDPALLGALRQASADAAEAGVELHVTSGWRSAEDQAQLLREAVARYGSEQEARRWVATPETSAHVSGDAIDVGPADATTWLSEHGAAYGLCQIYGNEPWHFELRPDAVDDGCPPMYADPTHDPRMQHD